MKVYYGCVNKCIIMCDLGLTVYLLLSAYGQCRATFSNYVMKSFIVSEPPSLFNKFGEPPTPHLLLKVQAELIH